MGNARQTLVYRRALYTMILTALALMPLASVGHAYQRPGRNEMIMVSSDGVQSNSTAQSFAGPTPGCRGFDTNHLAETSYDGRYVSFASDASNLVPGDFNQACDTFVRDRKTHKTEQVSVSNNGALALFAKQSERAGQSSISADGRRVAFISSALNLVDGDTNLATDIFVYDRKADKTIRVSVASDGTEGNGDSSGPSISGDGRFVSFQSDADNLVPEESNASPVPGLSFGRTRDVFIHDLKTRKTERVSVASDGSEPNGGSRASSMSFDGRFVVYESVASNIHPDDTDTSTDVFLRDRLKGVTELITVNSRGEHAKVLLAAAGYVNGSVNPLGGRSISADGRYVVYYSSAWNLVPNDSMANVGNHDVFVLDRHTRRVQQISVTSSGEDQGEATGGSISPDGRYISLDAKLPGNEFRNPYFYDTRTGAMEFVAVPLAANTSEDCQHAYAGPISNGGRFVGFWTCATTMVEDDTNDVYDLFLRDRGTEVFSNAEERQVRVSNRPLFETQGFTSAEDPVADIGPGSLIQGADLIGARLAYRPQTSDLYVSIDVLRMAGLHSSIGSAGLDPSILYGFRFKIGDAAFEMRAQQLAHSAAGEAAFGLFRCDPRGSCEHTAALRGGYGTTGEAVVMTVPLSELEIGGDLMLEDAGAYTARGTNALGALNILDEVLISE